MECIHSLSAATIFLCLQRRNRSNLVTFIAPDVVIFDGRKAGPTDQVTHIGLHTGIFLAVFHWQMKWTFSLKLFICRIHSLFSWTKKAQTKFDNVLLLLTVRLNFWLFSYLNC